MRFPAHDIAKKFVSVSRASEGVCGSKRMRGFAAGVSPKQRGTTLRVSISARLLSAERWLAIPVSPE
jgi:hypothetical protein